jgi:hypothetical protein
VVGTAAGGMTTPNAGDLIVSKNATTSGYLVVGTVNPTVNMSAGDLLTGGSVTTTGSLYVGNDAWFNGTTSPYVTNVYNLGQVSYAWRNVYAQNTSIISDVRLKDNISDLNYGLDQILALRPVNYTWKDQPDEGTQIGFVAQDVLPIMPELVDIGSNEDKTLSLHYDKFVTVLAKAIQEQQAEIQDLINQQNNTSTPLAVIDNPDANLQTLAVQQAATFYGTIYIKGEAGFESKVVFEKDIEVKGKIYASADQAGTATILANATSTEIVFGQEYEAVPKITANLKGTNDNPLFVNWLISDQTIKGFRIIIAQVQTQDITFDWIALAVKDQTQPTNNVVLGCLDQTALNYNPSANTEDGSCQYPAPPDTGDGSVPPAEEPIVTTPPEETPPPAEEPIVVEIPVTTPTEPTPDTTPTEPSAETPVTDNTPTTPSPADTAGVGGDDWTLVN